MGTRKDEKSGTSPAEGRRFFLKGAGIAGAAAAATLATAGQPAAATEKRDEARKARYRETEHVRRFYATNRY